MTEDSNSSVLHVLDPKPSGPVEIDLMDIKWEHLVIEKYLFGCLTSLCLTRTLTYPLVFAKTMLQVQPALKGLRYTQIIRSTLRDEGVRGMYRGCPTYLLGVIPSSAIYIYSFEVLRSKIFPGSNLENQKIVVSSWISSFISLCISNPSDVISQRLMVRSRLAGHESHSAAHDKTLLSSIKKIIHMEGVRGLYKGFTLSLFMSAITSSLWWFTYHNLKQNLEIFFRNENPSRSQYIMTQSFCGATSTLITASLIQPFDVLKTRFQVLKATSWRALVQHLYRTEGLKWMTRGIRPRLMSMVPASAFTIGIYEEVKRRSLKPNLIPVHHPKKFSHNSSQQQQQQQQQQQPIHQEKFEQPPRK